MSDMDYESRKARNTPGSQERLASTPGPWRVGVVGYAPMPAFDLPTVRTKDGQHVAYVFATDADDAQALATAHLIAAAPDLLAALEDAVDGLEYHQREYGSGFQNRIDTARAAIKKAKGL